MTHPDPIEEMAEALGADLPIGEQQACGPLAWLRSAIATLREPAVIAAAEGDDADAYFHMVGELEALETRASTALLAYRAWKEGQANQEVMGPTEHNRRAFSSAADAAELPAMAVAHGARGVTKSVTLYRGYHIYHDPPPIPVRNCDWHYYHDDYDGAEDACDPRHGHCASEQECRDEIDMAEDD